MPKYTIPWEEFQARMEGFDGEERRIIEHRLRTNYKLTELQFLTQDEAATLGAMLDRLIPQDEGENKLDLVGFMDWAIPLPLGYGDREEGKPDEATAFKMGLQGVEQTSKQMFGVESFSKLSGSHKDEVLRAIQEGSAEGKVWNQISSTTFFKRLMEKAVAGYCAHPRTWMRIGFYGPAYPEGYIWVSQSEVIARHEKKPGHLTF